VKRGGLVALWIWMAAGAGQAQGQVQRQAKPPPQVPTDLNSCLAVTDDAERLACYDGRAGGKAMVGLPSSPAAQDPGPVKPPLQLPAKRSDSFLARYWELDPGDKRGTFNYTAYRPNYFLPLREMARVHRYPSSPSRGIALTLPPYQHGEAKLQLSMRSKVMENALLPGADLWVAYTQQSMWQLWNQAQSAPFRNTDFQPEVIYVVPTPDWLRHGPAGWTWQMSEFGFVHQSNGQSGALSRSWNRLYASAGIEHGGVTAALRIEKRLERSGNQQDDNADIGDHLGRIETQLTWSPGHAMATLLWRPSWRGRGSVQLDWTYPIHQDRPDGLRWYIQGFQGFGETLLDYNIRQTSLGFGLTLFKF
jgi:phospholipase A1